jgi:hypothetical protein
LFGCPPCLKTKTTNEKAPKKNKKNKKEFCWLFMVQPS